VTRALAGLIPLAVTAALLSAHTAQPDGASGAAPGSRPVRTLALDAGHGGDDPGVEAESGVLEKQVTLSLARRLKPVLEARGDVRVVLTREDDRALTPDQRAGAANAAGADVFVSLHANSSPRPAASGPEVLVHLPRAAGAGLAAEPLPAPVLLPTPGGPPRPLAFVPWHGVQDRHIPGARQLADTLAATLATRLGTAPRPIQAAPLRTLAGVDAAALHLEVAYLTNAGDAARVMTETFPAQVAEALADALVHYWGTAEASH